MPPPRAAHERPAGAVRPDAPFSGFVFKIQANMDKAHRDRVAFVRICSGRFERGMKVLHVRTGKRDPPRQPHAVPRAGAHHRRGGLRGRRHRRLRPRHLRDRRHPDRGAEVHLRGDPELLRPSTSPASSMIDPMRRKQLKKGLEQLAQEGTIQLYRPHAGREGRAILGAVGRLQLEVVKLPDGERVRRRGAPRDDAVRVRPLGDAQGRARRGPPRPTTARAWASRR